MWGDKFTRMFVVSLASHSGTNLKFSVRYSEQVSLLQSTVQSKSGLKNNLKEAGMGLFLRNKSAQKATLTF